MSILSQKAYSRILENSFSDPSVDLTLVILNPGLPPRLLASDFLLIHPRFRRYIYIASYYTLLTLILLQSITIIILIVINTATVSLFHKVNATCPVVIELINDHARK
jgi:uncharacterized integral membrane protein